MKRGETGWLKTSWIRMRNGYYINRRMAERRIAKKLGLTYIDTSAVIKMFLNLIKQTVEEHHRVYLYGFGKFQAHHWPARKGRNPRLGKVMRIPSLWTVAFYPSTAFRREMRKPNRNSHTK